MSQQLSPTLLPDRRQMRVIETAWEAFMSGMTTDLDKVRPVIRESWQRAQRFGVNPYLREIPLVLSAEELEGLQERADLVYVADSVFELLVKAWKNEPFLIGLNDRQGRILRISGHPWILQRAQEIKAVPGGGMSEELVGTAVVNVVLSQDCPDYVLWSENYVQSFHPWASVGAPIRHPLSGETIGVLAISGYERVCEHADTVIHLVERIETFLHHEELLRRVALLDEYHRFMLQHPHDAILAVDARGRVCGASSSATDLFKSPIHVLGQSLLRVPDFHVEGFRPVVDQEEVRPYDVRVKIPEKAWDLKADAIPINGERQPVGTLLILPRPSSSRSNGTPVRKEPRSIWTALAVFSDLVGNSPSIKQCLTLAQRVAMQDFPILLLGESGTGKDLFAQAMHKASPRGYGPFVPVNCGAASDDLLAAELFGYVEGAFTGAVKGGRIGKIELAHRGTLFLDEVEAMSPRMQVSLLRVLEEGRLTRMGAEQPTPLNVRIIAASNEDLKDAVTQKRFRLDLYHRLSVFPLTLPPLRERLDDLPELITHFLRQLGCSELRLSPEVLPLLRCYAWPGNVRELRNVLLRAAHAATGSCITPAELPEEIVKAGGMKGPEILSNGRLRESELILIRQALAEANGNLAQAAARLGIHRVTLYRKMKRYAISY
ncbi:MAG: sigma-54-dependent Fis family transcriptional regulator [Candidatus Binatia bacterium]